MRRLVVTLAGATGCFALPASAQPSAGDTAALNWSRMPGTEACPDLAELARRVGQHLKRDAFVSPTKATVLVDASIQPVEPGFRVRIVLSSSDQATPGERALTSLSPDCNEAVDSAALAIALMLDPDALTRSDVPAATPDASTSATETAESAAAQPAPVAPAPSTRPSPLETAAEPEPPVPQQRRLGPSQLALGALASANQVPGNSVGVMLGLRLLNRARSLGVNLEAGYLAPRRLTIPVQERAVGGEFSLLSGQLSGAWSPYRRAPLVLSVLAGPQFARVLASGFGFTGSNREVGSWLVSSTVEGEATWALSEHWDLLLRLGLGVPIWRDSFEASTSSGVTTILEPSPFFGTLKVALAVSP